MLGDTDGPLLAQVLARQGIELYWSEREQAVAELEAVGKPALPLLREAARSTGA